MTFSSFFGNGVIDAFRHQTVELLDRVAQTAVECELPLPPEAFSICRNKLDENKFLVLVAGEAKRGKSSFINSLLGRNLLPTDVDIATSQIFRIQQAPVEGYFLRYEDDSTQPIAATDLFRYGSQVADQSGFLPRNQTIRWIEVQGPVAFLPPGMELLDTPGLGSLYREHGRITQRFVPLADGVIFVLHSDSPIGREEIEFLEEILGVTRNVFFIQTMIDLYGEKWQAIQTRNQQVLKDRFGDRLPSPQVWPISSANLLKAAQTGDGDYALVSKFPALAQALQEFLFAVAGWSRTAEALLVADGYHRQAARILNNRIEGLENVGNPHQTPLRQQMQQKLNQVGEWAENGPNRQDLLKDLRQAAADAKQVIWRALQPGCKIEIDHREKINGITSLDQAKQLGGSLSAQVLDKISDRWRKSVGQFNRRCGELLQPFLRATDLGLPDQEDIIGDLAIRSGRDLGIGEDPYFKVMVAANEFVNGSLIAGSVGLVGVTLIAASWFPPVAIAGVLVAGIWGALRGWVLTGDAQIQGAREALHRHLDEVMRQVHGHFFSADPGTGHTSLVEHYFDGQLRFLSARVARQADLRLNEIQGEIARLEEESQLDEHQRHTRAKLLSQQINNWTEMGSEIKVVTKQLKHMDHLHGALATASSTSP